MTRPHEWGAMTRAEIAAARDAGAFPVLPIGSVEQHGDFMPVDTDLALVAEIALRAARSCESAWPLVLPPLAYSVAPEHAAWAGTLSLSLPTFAAVVTDLVGSLRNTGFERVLLLNGHGGNQAALDSFGAALRVTVANYWSPGQPEWLPLLPGAKRGMGHACAYELSLQMALRPHTQPVDLPPILLRPGRDRGSGTLDIPPGHPGYYGDPAAATEAAGHALLNATVAGLIRCFETF